MAFVRCQGQHFTKRKHVKYVPFEPECNDINDVDVKGDEKSSRSFHPIRRDPRKSDIRQLLKIWCDDLPEGTSSKTHRAPDVHGVPKHVEGETFNPVVHKDTKVVSQEGSGDTQSPCGGDDECLA